MLEGVLGAVPILCHVVAPPVADRGDREEGHAHALEGDGGVVEKTERGRQAEANVLEEEAS